MAWSVLLVITANDWFHLHVPMVYVSPTPTYFAHKHIHQAAWYPSDPSRPPRLKDYILVKRKMMPSVLDTRVFRGVDIESDHSQYD